MKKILPWVILVCCFLSVNAQYPAGYIVTNENDTLDGYLKPQGSIIWYKYEVTDEPEKFMAKDVASYTLGNTEFKYRCFEVLNGTFPQINCSYLKKLNKGYVSLYKYMPVNIYGEIQLPNYYIQKPGHEMVRVKRGKWAFNRELKLLLGDCESLLKDLKAGKYEPYQIKQVINDYNEWKGMYEEDL